MTDLREKWGEFVKKAPASPGVYIFRDGMGRVIYIGKSNNLKDRIKAYADGGDGRFLTSRIYRETESVEFIITSTASEALFLEDRLIKEKKPRYNIQLKDDKSYMCIVLEKKTKWPRLKPMRKPDVKNNVVFGPFPSAKGTRRLLDFLQYIFPLRTCSDEVMKRHSSRPCVEYELGRCMGPCAGLVSEKEYMEVVSKLERTLKRGNADLEGLLEQKMREKAEREEFEQAAGIRDVLLSLRTMSSGLGFSRGGREMFDAAGFFFGSRGVSVSVISYRGGVMSGIYRDMLKVPALPFQEVVDEFLRSYYGSGRFVPPRIYLSHYPDDVEALTHFLSHIRGSKVRLSVPKRAPYREIVESACDNAELYMREGLENDRWDGEEVAKLIGLEGIISRMEAFDISRYGASFVVGSCVAMVDGKLAPEFYRRYRVTENSGDDYSAMREVIRRRLKRGIKENSLPDVILVDGGRGHLNAVEECVKKMGLRDQIYVLSVSKGRGTKDRLDVLHLPDGRDLIMREYLNTPLRHFLTLRDEAHRFAISYLKKLDEKLKRTSLLLSIPGIGKEKAREIIFQVGSVERLKTMKLEELTNLHGIGDKMANRIYSYFHGGDR